MSKVRLPVRTTWPDNKSNVHFSSQHLDWKTPKGVYQELESEFNFDYDPCPTAYSKNGLKTEWGERNFVNPPYGRELPKWMAKAYEQWQKGKTIIMLVPSRTDTRWWHNYVMEADEVRFIKGRLKFEGYNVDQTAPFPSAIVIFRGSIIVDDKEARTEE